MTIETQLQREIEKLKEEIKYYESLVRLKQEAIEWYKSRIEKEKVKKIS